MVDFRMKVAPHVGAWIETAYKNADATGHTSRPTWARGLKHLHLGVGALVPKSRPTWARGLKRGCRGCRGFVGVSRPTWARGLKLTINISYTINY